MSIKRVFLIVLDSLGIGETPDAKEYGDEGSNTLKAISKSKKFNANNLRNLGLFNIDGVDMGEKAKQPTASYARMNEKSKGKDTTIGHWEIAGIVSKKPLPTFPNGFPEELIKKFSNATGKGVICNKTYSGTQVIADYGQHHIKTGDLIVYTSADSVFQIAAHEQVVPIEKLYEYCEIAREMLVDEWAVGRVIARPFIGEQNNFTRTANRQDFSLAPPSKTMLDVLKQNSYDVIAVGKIEDIFAKKGVTKSIKTRNNTDGMQKMLELLKQDFNGLCFINLVDFDMLFGHRNDVDGYANALSEFDAFLPSFIDKLNNDDVVIITADHGCDPSTQSTDHSREYTPMIIYGEKIKKGVNLNTRDSFADISATILNIFNIENDLQGKSFKKEILK